jgi:hypothetical protein
MADLPKLLGQVLPPATTLTLLYTVPTGTVTVVSSIVICNTSGSPANVRVSVAYGGAADDRKQYVYYDLPITANDTFVATIGITLNTTDVIRVQSSVLDVTFNLFGIEATSDVTPSDVRQMWLFNN